MMRTNELHQSGVSLVMLALLTAGAPGHA